MASVRKHRNSKFWYACVTGPDGRQFQFSTGITDQTEALAAAMSAERELRRHGAQPSKLHHALSRIADEYAPAEHTSPEQWLDGWTKRMAGTWAPDTRRLYADSIAKIKTFLSEAHLRTFSAIGKVHAERFRAGLAATHAPGTVNANVSRLRAAWAAAVADGVAQENPFAALPPLKTPATKRREFRPAELETLLATVRGEWRTLTLLGIYTGQRLNDLATLHWRNLDLQTGTIHFTAAKTRALVSLPLLPVCVDSLLTDVPVSDDPDAPVFPTLATLPHQARSDQFRGILESVGLALPSVRHQRRSRSKSHPPAAPLSLKRTTAPLSFHSLRHSCTSMLKAAGVSDAIARAIVGHKSEEISRVYTHLDMDTMRREMLKMG